MFSFDVPAPVLGFLAVHAALRAEVVDITTLAVHQPEVARRRAELLGRVLGHHHRAEDDLLWPTLLERQPDLAPVLAELEADHEHLDDVLGRLPDELDLAGRLQRTLEAHLQAEEQHALPVWLQALTPDEHERFGAALRRHTPLRDAGLMMSWLLDHAPAGARELATPHVPRSLRLVNDLWCHRRYVRRWGHRTTLVALPGVEQAPAIAAA